MNHSYLILVLLAAGFPLGAPFARADESTRLQYEVEPSLPKGERALAGESELLSALSRAQAQDEMVRKSLAEKNREMKLFDSAFLDAREERSLAYPSSLDREEVNAMNLLLRETDHKAKPSFLIELLAKESPETIARAAILSRTRPGFPTPQQGYTLEAALAALKSDPSVAKLADAKLQQADDFSIKLSEAVMRAKQVRASSANGNDFFGRFRLLEQKAKSEVELTELWNKHTMTKYGMTGAEYANYLEKQRSHGLLDTFRRNEAAYLEQQAKNLKAGTRFFGATAGLAVMGDFFGIFRDLHGAPETPSHAAVLRDRSVPVKAPTSEASPPSPDFHRQPLREQSAE